MFNFKKIIYLTLTISIVCFIFYNSLQNGTSSSNASDFVLNFLNDMFKNIGLNFYLTGHMVRKTAHFVEFFVFGFFVMLTFNEFNKKTFSALGFPMFFAIFIPVVDEFIQLYSVGRSSSVKDVLLDFSGAMTGILMVATFIWLINKKRRKNKYRYTYNF